MLLHYHSTPLTPCNCKKLLYIFSFFFSIIGFKCCILGRIHFRQSAGSGLWILSNSPMCKLSNIHVYCIFAKLNSNFNLNLNWVEFSITFVLSDHHPPPTHHPPGLVVELKLPLQFQLLSLTTTSSITWVWPSSATACSNLLAKKVNTDKNLEQYIRDTLIILLMK